MDVGPDSVQLQFCGQLRHAGAGRLSHSVAAGLGTLAVEVDHLGQVLLNQLSARRPCHLTPGLLRVNSHPLRSVVAEI
jgi:hypothetical protein